MLQHGHAKRSKETKTYKSWQALKDRCFNPNNPQYHDYGGRGITVDPRWLEFSNFLIDMGERPENTSIDRIDNNGIYCKKNCKWSTRYEQQVNQRIRKTNSTGEPNIIWYKPYQLYQVQVCRSGKRKTVGYYKDIPSAKEARDNYLKDLNNAY